MRATIATLFFTLIFTLHLAGQTSDPKRFYQDAFAEQLKMLTGQKPLDFKRAVFVTENAYNEGKLNYPDFCNNIFVIQQHLKTLIQQRGLERFKTAGNWAVFSYMTDSLPINDFKPYVYDFDDFMGEKDYTKMFVTKLMKTKSGNCHSMPTLYKILCEEIGANASLALAPNHLYIKHIDERGQWTNIELTNGGFPRDQWIIKEMAITVEAIKSGAYMTPLSQKESIAMTMFDLANGYESQYGYDEFVLTVTDKALSYFPKCIPLLMIKANYYRHEAEIKKRNLNVNMQSLKDIYALYKKTVAQIDALGYKEMPAEQYEEWIKSVEKEKSKRLSSSK